MKLEMATVQVELDPSNGAGEGGTALQAVALAGFKDGAVRERKESGGAIGDLVDGGAPAVLGTRGVAGYELGRGAGNELYL